MKRVGNEVGQVKQVEGVPDWLTYVQHLRNRGRCTRLGHDGTYTCTWCGLILRRVVRSDRTLAGLYFVLVEREWLVKEGFPLSELQFLESRFIDQATENPTALIRIRKWAQANGW